MSGNDRWRLPPPTKRGTLYAEVWRRVDEGIRIAFIDHPEYLTEAGRQAARYSILKRVTGRVVGLMKPGQPTAE